MDTLNLSQKLTRTLPVLVFFLSAGANAFTGSDNDKAFKARAQLQPRSSSAASGSIYFTAQDNKLLVDVNLRGVEPGLHGFHIHENGDCSADDFSSAGGHFNPTDAKHAGADSRKRHAGDMGNLQIGSDGQLQKKLTLERPKGLDSWSAIAGKAVILHSGKDDLASQPSGAAGNRIACGVIQKVNNVSE